jgi:hypothetical protein
MIALSSIKSYNNLVIEKINIKTSTKDAFVVEVKF